MATGTLERVVEVETDTPAASERALTGRGPRPAPRSSALQVVRRVLAATAGVLLVIGASTIGLHEWADAHLGGVVVHDGSSGR